MKRAVLIITIVVSWTSSTRAQCLGAATVCVGRSCTAAVAAAVHAAGTLIITPAAPMVFTGTVFIAAPLQTGVYTLSAEGFETVAFLVPEGQCADLVIMLHETASACVGDLNGDRVVTIDEIVTTVATALEGCQ